MSTPTPLVSTLVASWKRAPKAGWLGRSSGLGHPTNWSWLSPQSVRQADQLLLGVLVLEMCCLPAPPDLLLFRGLEGRSYMSRLPFSPHLICGPGVNSPSAIQRQQATPQITRWFISSAVPHIQLIWPIWICCGTPPGSSIPGGPPAVCRSASMQINFDSFPS